jgi:hypothetical protein
METICSQQVKFGNDTKTFWFRFQNHYRIGCPFGFDITTSYLFILYNIAYLFLQGMHCSLTLLDVFSWASIYFDIKIVIDFIVT